MEKNKPALKENNLYFYSEIETGMDFSTVSPLSLARIGEMIILQLCLNLAPHRETQNANQYISSSLTLDPFLFKQT